MDTKETTHYFTREEADKFIRNFKGPVGFAMKVTTFLPINGGDKGYDGVAFVTVGRDVFRQSVAMMLAKSYELKGAKIKISVTPSWREGGKTYITTY